MAPLEVNNLLKEPFLLANRNRLTQDFGFVALDINQLIELDTGVYMVRAYNRHGEAFTSARLGVQGEETPGNLRV